MYEVKRSTFPVIPLNVYLLWRKLSLLSNWEFQFFLQVQGGCKHHKPHQTVHQDLNTSHKLTKYLSINKLSYWKVCLLIYVINAFFSLGEYFCFRHFCFSTGLLVRKAIFLYQNKVKGLAESLFIYIYVQLRPDKRSRQAGGLRSTDLTSYLLFLSYFQHLPALKPTTSMKLKTHWGREYILQQKVFLCFSWNIRP